MNNTMITESNWTNAEQMFLKDFKDFIADKSFFTESVERRILFLLGEFKARTTAPTKVSTGKTNGKEVVIKEVEKPIYVYLTAAQAADMTNKIKPTHEDLISEAMAVCEKHGVQYEIFMKPLNGKADTQTGNARREFCLICKNKYVITLKEIGDFLDVDHTTILHYLPAKKKIKHEAGN